MDLYSTFHEAGPSKLDRLRTGLRVLCRDPTVPTSR